MKVRYLSETEFSILKNLQSKSEETYRHSVNVSELSIALGIACQLPFKALRILWMGGILHDVGKLEVPPAILNKNGKLNEEEAREMHRHSVYGETLLRAKAGEKDEAVLDIVRHHHEKNGGTGYPDGILERQLLVQIVTVADMYDALRSDRCYRKGYSDERTFAMLYGDDGINHSIVDRLYTISGSTVPYIRALGRKTG